MTRALRPGFAESLTVLAPGNALYWRKGSPFPCARPRYQRPHASRLREQRGDLAVRHRSTPRTRPAVLPVREDQPRRCHCRSGPVARCHYRPLGRFEPSADWETGRSQHALSILAPRGLSPSASFSQPVRVAPFRPLCRMRFPCRLDSHSGNERSR